MVSVVHDDALVLIPGKNRCGDLPRLKNAESLFFNGGYVEKIKLFYVYRIPVCL